MRLGTSRVWNVETRPEWQVKSSLGSPCIRYSVVLPTSFLQRMLGEQTMKHWDDVRNSVPYGTKSRPRFYVPYGTKLRKCLSQSLAGLTRRSRNPRQRSRPLRSPHGFGANHGWVWRLVRDQARAVAAWSSSPSASTTLRMVSKPDSLSQAQRTLRAITFGAEGFEVVVAKAVGDREPETIVGGSVQIPREVGLEAASSTDEQEGNVRQGV